MLIDFKSIEEQVIPNMKGGEKEYNVRRFDDGVCRIMMGRLVPGASVGYHKHETDSETMYFLEGSGKVIYDDGEFTVASGDCHYCPKGHSHSVINNGTEDLVYFAIVAVQ